MLKYMVDIQGKAETSEIEGKNGHIIKKINNFTTTNNMVESVKYS